MEFCAMIYILLLDHLKSIFHQEKSIFKCDLQCEQALNFVM